MDIKIERLQKNEYLRLKNIRLQSLQDAPLAFATTFDTAKNWNDDVWKSQAADIPTFLASQNSNDIGIVRASPDKNSLDRIWLISMWVSPNARGKKIGEGLITALLTWARSMHLKEVALDVGAKNLHATALYQKMGFKKSGAKSQLPSPRNHVCEEQMILSI